MGQLTQEDQTRQNDLRKAESWLKHCQGKIKEWSKAEADAHKEVAARSVLMACNNWPDNPPILSARTGVWNK